MQLRIAIYDLDRTVLATPTFTAFLLHSAFKTAPWRLLLLPLWLLAMLGHAAGLYGRNQLKPFGIRLMIGGRITTGRMAMLASSFADRVVPADVQPGAAAMIARDTAQGYRLLLATAAPQFYAEYLGNQLGFEAVLATRHHRDSAGNWLAAIDGTNCYGAEKLHRIQHWLTEQQIDRAQAHIRFYSDDISDAPALDFADEAFAVNAKGRFAAAAALNGWLITDFASGTTP